MFYAIFILRYKTNPINSPFDLLNILCLIFSTITLKRLTFSKCEFSNFKTIKLMLEVGWNLDELISSYFHWYGPLPSFLGNWSLESVNTLPQNIMAKKASYIAEVSSML